MSRGKWSDPLVDSGREWIVPDALARGELLYRDVVYWFGPFPPYLHASVFRLFGSSFRSLVLAGALASAGCLLSLFWALRRVTGMREAVLWTALAVPALVFMPNGGGSLLGMGYRIWHAAAFTLLAVAIVVGRDARGAMRPCFAGALAGVAGLCRTEWGLAAVVAVLLAILIQGRPARRPAVEMAAAVTGFGLVFGSVLGGFAAVAGSRAVLAEGHLLFSRMPEETRTFLVAFSGIREWRQGVPELLYSAAMWAGAFLLVDLLVAERSGRGARGRLVALAAVGVVLAVATLSGGASSAVIFSAAPAISVAALVSGLRRGRGPRAAALAAFGLLGVVLCYRRPFHIADVPYVAPPLLFGFVSAAGLLRTVVASRRPRRARVALCAAWNATLALLVASAFVWRGLGYAADDRIGIPDTAGLLSARPDLAREIDALARAIRRDTATGEGLVVFPQGELLNFLSGRINPIRHKLYVPGYLTDENEGEILEELERARPAAVVLWQQSTGEYGRSFFGVDYGRRLRAWIERNYDLEPVGAPGLPPRSSSRFAYGRIKTAP